MLPVAPGEALIVGLTAALGAACAGTAALVLISRWRFDRQRHLLQTAYGILSIPGRPGDAAPRIREATAILERAPASLLWALAADATVPRALERLVASALLGQQGVNRVLAAATRGTTWMRAAALRTLALTGHEARWTLLGQAIHDPNRDLGRAVVSLLGQLRDAEAAELLAHALRAGRIPRSRVATALDQFPLAVPQVVASLLWSDDADVRFWACVLMRRYPSESDLLDRLVSLTTDASPAVRKAAVDTLGYLRNPRGTAAVRACVLDPVPFVRAHAVRALGTLGGLADAGTIAQALGDGDWWVRSAAKQTLEQAGPGVADAVIPMLDDHDGFARNGAAEVLQNTGVYEQLLVEEAEHPGDPERLRVLSLLVSAGGRPMFNGRLIRVPASIRVRARALASATGPSEG